MTITKQKAKYIAEKELRFTVGNIPFLGDVTRSSNAFVFPIYYRTKGDDSTLPNGYKIQIGEICVGKENGTVTRTPNHKLLRAIPN